MLRTTFRSQGLGEGRELPRPLFYGRGGRRARPPVGEGSGPHHKCATAHFLCCPTLCVIQSEAKNPGSFLRHNRKRATAGSRTPAQESPNRAAASASSLLSTRPWPAPCRDLP